MKAFFGKIWAWVLAHKVLAAIIAGATVVVLTVAIVVPVSVSSAKKRKAAQEQETQQQTDGGKEQQGGDVTPGHTHTYAFDSFVWTTTSGAYKAEAKYICSGNPEHVVLYDAQMSKVAEQHIDATCEGTGKDVWKAVYDGHEETKDEVLDAKGHQWGEPTWNWVGFTQATAHFVCLNDSSHTHDEVATGAMIHEEVTDPTCAVAGKTTYTATVTFNGTNYNNSVEDPISATGVHTPDEHGFCNVCGQYTGDTQAIESDFVVNASGTYFFRVPYNPGQHFWFLLDSNQMQGVGAARAYVLNENNEFVEQTGAYDAFVDQYSMDVDQFPTLMFVSETSIDGYLYVEIDEESNSGLNFDMRANTYHLHNAAGLCIAGDDYLGSPAELNDRIYLGEYDGAHYNLGSDDQEYYSFICEPTHSYRLSKDLIEAGEIYFYYVSRTSGELVELVRSAGVFITPNSTVFNGNVYAAICPTAASTDAYIRLTVEGHGDPLEFDDYGFCAAGDGYIGNIIPSDYTETGINIDEGDMGFYAFEFEPGHKYSFGDNSLEIAYNWIRAYVIDKDSGDITELQLTHSNPLNYTDVMQESEDNYIYLVIEPGANVVSGELTITTIHVREHGLCMGCYDYIGTQLSYDEVADPITVAEGESVYFKFDLAELPANKPVLDVTYTTSMSSSTAITDVNVTLWYLKDLQWVQLEPDDWYGGNFDEEYYPTMGITTDDGNIYIHILADKDYTASPGFKISAVESGE